MADSDSNSDPEDSPPLTMFLSMMIYCTVCGTLIDKDLHSEDNVDSTIHQRLIQQQELGSSGVSRRGICRILRSAAREVERMVFDKHPWAWKTLYRVIVKNYKNGLDEECQYRLSGIAAFVDWDDIEGEFEVPRNRDDAYFGWVWDYSYRDKIKEIEFVYLAEDLQGTEYYRDPYRPQWRPRKSGYPVHARCWNLIERVIGKAEVEKHLDKLVDALRLSFEKQIIDPPWYFDDDYIPRLSVPYDLPGFNLKAGDEVAYNPQIAYELLDDETRYLHRDPVRIAEVDCLFKDASLSGSEKRKKKKKKNKTVMATKHDIAQEHHPSHHGGPFAALGLALEIQYLILDHLDRHDVAILHAAFTGPWEWAVPDSYWIMRAPKKLVYEIQDFINDENQNNVDWEYLCLKADQLVQTSEQLKNRQRIIDVLEVTKNSFYGMIREE